MKLRWHRKHNAKQSSRLNKADDMHKICKTNLSEQSAALMRNVCSASKLSVMPAIVKLNWPLA